MIIDLSHPIEDGLVTYQGLPPARITSWLTHEQSRGRYAPGTEFHIGRMEIVANTGTYLDSPFHRFPGAEDVAAVDLAGTVDLPGLLVRAETRAIDADLFRHLDVAGKAVLFRTYWDRYWRSNAYFADNPHLTKAAAEALVAGRAALVGIDSSNIDDIGDRARPAHTELLRAKIGIVEHLRGLDQLPTEGFRFFAAPLPVRGLGSSPVRAFAIV